MVKIFFILDIFIEISKYLDIISIMNLLRTDKELYNIKDNDIIWQYHNTQLGFLKPEWFVNDFLLTKIIYRKYNSKCSICNFYISESHWLVLCDCISKRNYYQTYHKNCLNQYFRNKKRDNNSLLNCNCPFCNNISMSIKLKISS